jgi:hypothetical protein
MGATLLPDAFVEMTCDMNETTSFSLMVDYRGGMYFGVID